MYDTIDLPREKYTTFAPKKRATAPLTKVQKPPNVARPDKEDTSEESCCNLMAFL
jgi:hypothetical protein